MNLEQKRIIQAIVNTFETGVPEGGYDAVTILRDGAGISYGRSQATDGGDNLDHIVYRYFDLGGRYSEELRAFVDELEADATTTVDPANPPPWCRALMALLQAAGSDPIMRRAQDEIFDERYWVPAENQSRSMGLVLPLSWAVVYDTCIHSGPAGLARIRKLFAEVPPSNQGDEKSWTSAYVAARERWLANHPKVVLHPTTYRMRTFRALIAAGNWDLVPPFKVLGATLQ